MIKVMLASVLDDLDKLRFPVLGSPKLDGYRATSQSGVLLSRNHIAVRNKFVQQRFGGMKLNGLDGELILGNPADHEVFRRTASACAREDGEPDINYYVFDRPTTADGQLITNLPFTDRIRSAEGAVGKRNQHVFIVPQKLIRDVAELVAFEEECLGQHFEGAMVRDPAAIYKQGRSTVNEGYLLKLKKFLDAEAVVLGIVEKLHNANEATRQTTGRLKRSHKMENLVPMGTMGSLYVQDIKTGVEFNVGTGFDDAERMAVWANPADYLGKVLTYKYFPTGSKDKPRHPVFKGWRYDL